MIVNPPAQATITGPHGHGPFRWHASYTIGIMCVEAGSSSWTRKGIERKARRTVGKLQREHDLHTQPAGIITSETTR